MVGVVEHPAQLDLAGQARGEGIGDVVLVQLPQPQQETYRKRSASERSMSVTTGGTAPKSFKSGGRVSASAATAGCGSSSPPSTGRPPCTGPDGRGEVGHVDDDPEEAVGLGRVVRGAHLQGHLVLVTQIDLGGVPTLLEIEEVQLVALLAVEQRLWDDPVLDRRGGALRWRSSLSSTCHQKS